MLGFHLYVYIVFTKTASGTLEDVFTLFPLVSENLSVLLFFRLLIRRKNFCFYCFRDRFCYHLQHIIDNFL